MKESVMKRIFPQIVMLVILNTQFNVYAQSEVDTGTAQNTEQAEPTTESSEHQKRFQAYLAKAIENSALLTEAENAEFADDLKYSLSAIVDLAEEKDQMDLLVQMGYSEDKSDLENMQALSSPESLQIQRNYLETHLKLEDKTEHAQSKEKHKRKSHKKHAKYIQYYEKNCFYDPGYMFLFTKMALFEDDGNNYSLANKILGYSLAIPLFLAIDGATLPFTFAIGFDDTMKTCGSVVKTRPIDEE